MIDDDSGCTLACASTLDPEVRPEAEGKTKQELAGLVGALVARRARSKGIEQVVFDRGGCKYHGRVKRLADGAREEGLRF